MDSSWTVLHYMQSLRYKSVLQYVQYNCTLTPYCYLLPENPFDANFLLSLWIHHGLCYIICSLYDTSLYYNMYSLYNTIQYNTIQYNTTIIKQWRSTVRPFLGLALPG